MGPMSGKVKKVAFAETVESRSGLLSPLSASDVDIVHSVRKAKSLDNLKASLGSEENIQSYRNERGSSLLHIASYFGNAGLAKELMSLGLSLDEKNRLQWSSINYLSRFHQPLNRKVNIGLRPCPAREQSKRFKFTYISAASPSSSGSGSGSKKASQPAPGEKKNAACC